MKCHSWWAMDYHVVIIQKSLMSSWRIALIHIVKGNCQIKSSSTSIQPNILFALRCIWIPWMQSLMPFYEHISEECLYELSLTTQWSRPAIQESINYKMRVRIFFNLNFLHFWRIDEHLICPGVAVRVAGDGNNYMHNKFCLIDVTLNEKDFNENAHPTKGLVMTGSLNWTSNVSTVTKCIQNRF